MGRSHRAPLRDTWTDGRTIAWQGASESRCQSLVNQHEVGFYASGGNPEWLQGLAKAPSKLQRLNRLNVRLARQPWLVGRDDLEVARGRARGVGRGAGQGMGRQRALTLLLANS